MKDFEKDIKEKFDGWATQPPPELWEKIEAELDRKKRPFAIIWVRTSMAAGLLLIGILIGKMNFSNKPIGNVARKETSTLLKNNEIKGEMETQSVAILPIKNRKKPFRQSVFANEKKSEENAQEAIFPVDLAAENSLPVDKNQEIVQVATSPETPNSEQSTVAFEKTVVEKVDPSFSKHFEEISKPTEVVSLPKPEPKAEPKSKWFYGINTGVVAMNTTYSGSQISMASGKAMADVSFGSVLPHVSSSAGIGTKFGLQFGYKIRSKVWLESGLNYVEAKSFVNSNMVAYNQAQGAENVFLATYLNESVQNSGFKAGINVAAAPETATEVRLDMSSQNYANDFTFMSVPVQAFTNLVTTKRLSLGLGTGLSADLLLQNALGNSQAKYKIEMADGVYKPLSFSGLGTAKVSYNVRKNIDTFLSGQVQMGLRNILHSGNSLELKLRQSSVNYGFQYKFH